MKPKLNPYIKLTEEGNEIPSNEMITNKKHKLYVSLNENNQYVYLNFSSRLAMYEFAKSILHEAVFGESGFKEFYPMADLDYNLEIIDGVRLTLNSARIFIQYNE